MRRLFALLLLCVPLAAFGQNIDEPSVLSFSSYGVFENELDAAQSVDETGPGPGFSELGNSYLFAGLANLELIINNGGAAASLGDPLTMGYYHSGDRIWSVFSNIYLGDFTPGTAPVVTYPGAAINKPVGADSYDYEDDMLVVAPKTRLASEVQKSTQFLTQFGDLNAGLFAGVTYDDNAAYNAGSNYTATHSYYYDAAAVADPPDLQTGYTTTEDDTTFDRTTNIELGVPLFLRTGDLAHLGNALVTWDRVRAGNETTLVYSDIGTDYDQAIAAGTYVALDRAYATGNTFGLALDYELTVPTFFDGHPENETTFGAMVDADLLTFSADVLEETNDIEYVIGNPKVDRLDATDVTTIEGRPALGFDVMASASQSFYFDLADGVQFGLVPSASAGFRFAPSGPFVETVTQVASQDNNDDGDFADAGDIIDTTVDSYTNYSYDVATDTAAPQENVKTISASVRLPASIQVRPEGWAFGLTVGAEPEITYARVATTVAGTSSSQTTSQVQGDGTVNNAEATDYNPTTAETTSVAHDWAATVDHSIAMNFVFAGGVKADVVVNFTNFLELDDLTAQVIIPLP